MIINIKRLLTITMVILIPFIIIYFLGTCIGDNRSKQVSNAQEESVVFDNINKVDIINNKIDKNSFFAEYRIERERLRGEQIEILREIIKNDTAEGKTKEAASMRLLQMMERAERELQAEIMVKSKGAEDCAVIMDKESAIVIIGGEYSEQLCQEEIRKVVNVSTDYNEKDINIILHQP